jgi:hypothetical protein
VAAAFVNALTPLDNLQYESSRQRKPNAERQS